MEKCSALRSCYVMDLDQLYQQVLNEGYMLIKGRKYSLSEILPDGLHLSDPAGDELARRMETLLESAIKKGLDQQVPFYFQSFRASNY